MKIVNNKTMHGVFCNGIMLVPGTNCIDDFDASTTDAKFFTEDGTIEIKDSDKMDDKEQAEAVKNANTHATLDTLQKTFKKVDTSKQKKKLDDFENAVKKASGVEEGE